MEHGTDEHRSIIAAAVAQELERAALDCHASGVLDKAFCFLPTHEQFNLASKVLEIDGLIGRMAASQRPAAERLLRVVSGTALMTEAQRQVNNAFPDTAEQSKVLKSLFGSSWWANMVGQFDASAVPELSNVLAAPTPLMMISEDSCDVMSAPQQQSMMLSTGFRQNEVDEMPWWATTTSQVLSQWSKEHEEHEYFFVVLINDLISISGSSIGLAVVKNFDGKLLLCFGNLLLRASREAQGFVLKAASSEVVLAIAMMHVYRVGKHLHLPSSAQHPVS